ncbi:uncharacterized protein B0P05DRAFT_572667 [Gilbertella persicaria]|uniref:Transcription factor n=1 Tax=Rhizopus stolonifer TaxID=4846 RepID=A0A367KPK5_RHIST|nr:uncharacterized protein B0P05DRAFT_572667 [Gilbertella persicaria]KAI8075955.1 hypothetical protein B0P05DRAFT_572667 [Gilbertella persicaria]RCI04077.1 transcription factor [Rhizopus stolonifer]
MSQPNNQSFNDSELSNGFHLLTESSDTVKVNTPSVPLGEAHLYPRLAGSNWTSYLSQPNIVLGRSVSQPTSKRKGKDVDVDFGSSKAISRRHCEIRFSTRRDRWELYVYSRNGVKINHLIKKPRDKPAVLKTGDLIEINNTSFVFILPTSFIKPRYPSQVIMSEGNTDSNVDQELETAVVQLLEKNNCLNTVDIVDQLKSTTNKTLNKDAILQLLVMSNKFHLAPNSVSMTSKESDAAKWMLMSEPEPDLPAIPEAKKDFVLPLFEDDEDWSVLVPDSPTEEEDQTDTQGSRKPPTLFRGLSIESIYTVWNASFHQEEEEEEVEETKRPSKRLRHTDSHESVISQAENEDIFKQVRTKIIA